MIQNQIYLMPIGSEDAVEHMYSTLLNSVEKNRIEAYGVSAPESVYDNGETNLWGLTPGSGNERQWNKFAEGDFVIFVPTKYNLIVTRITYKTRSKELAKSLWGTDERGETWELIFFVKELGFLEKDKKTFLGELGFKDNDYLMGNRRVTERFQEKYNSVEDFLKLNSENKISQDDFAQGVAEQLIKSSIFKDKKETEEERLAKLKELVYKAKERPHEKYYTINGKRINRNQIFVAYVKERDGYKCMFCGWELTTKDGKKYIEAAHIKPLSENPEMFDNLHNMVCLCPNCHKKLDKGDKKAKNEIVSKLSELGFKVE
jgi:predicted HNH restriction endonuclease